MRNILPAVFLVLFALTAATASGASAGAPAKAPQPVRVVTAERENVPVTYTVPGSVISDGQIEVSSRLVGFIEQLDVREGEHVARGDLLVRIDPTDIEEAIRQAGAGVRAAKDDLRDSELDVEKYEGLARKGAVATETLRKAQVRVDVAKATLDQARSALAAAEAQKTYASITSPVDGVVVSVAKRSGEMATAGATILTVESRDVLLFRAYISESRLAAIDPGLTVAVRIDSLNDAVFEGHVRGVVPSGDDVTRRYEINIVLPKNPRLVPGMFGRAEIVLGDREVTAIPRTALVRRGGLDGVFVLDGTIARFRWLRTGRDFGNSIEVVSGLSDGEEILATANDSVRDGSVVVRMGNAQ